MRTVERNHPVRGELLVVNGPAAAGKTTAARSLAERSTVPSVHLHADDFFKALKVGRRRGWESGAQPQHEVVFEAIGAAAGSYAAGGYLVVVDTLLRPPLLPVFVEAVAGRAKIDLVILRPHYDVLLSRSHHRDATARHNDDVLRWLDDAFRDLGDLERHVIDNSRHEPDETVTAIKALVDSGCALLTPREFPDDPRAGPL